MKSKFYKGFERGANIVKVFGISLLIINVFWLFFLTGMITKNPMMMASPIGLASFIRLIMEVRKK